MDVAALLLDLFGRVDEHVHEALDGLDESLLTVAPEPGTNPIGWLVWHLSRVGDHHVSELVGEEQLWVTGDWAPRFGLSADANDTGYGHGPDEVAAVQPANVAALTEYYEAVASRTRNHVGSLTHDDLDRVVDRRWTPHVTQGVRLISVADDEIQRAGQAVYARGLLERR